MKSLNRKLSMALTLLGYFIYLDALPPNVGAGENRIVQGTPAMNEPGGSHYMAPLTICKQLNEPPGPGQIERKTLERICKDYDRVSREVDIEAARRKQLAVAGPKEKGAAIQGSTMEITSWLNELVKKQDYNEIQNILSQQDRSAARLPWLRQQAEAGHVPLQFELSKFLAPSDPSEALNWFAIARIGATLDAALCDDKTAGSGVSALVMAYGRHIPSIGERNRYGAAIKQGLQWHDQHATRPSPLWICMHGMQAFTGQVRLIPTTQWESVQRITKQKISASLESMN
jgi:hypothetical protein